jgi:hypothetical protein
MGDNLGLNNNLIRYSILEVNDVANGANNGRSKDFLLGYNFGLAGKEMSSRLIEYYEEQIEKKFGLSFNEALKFSLANYFPFLEKVPRAYEEIKGISEGSGIPLEVLITILSIDELSDTFEEPPGKITACTNICARSNGNTYAGHNHEWFNPPSYIIVSHSDEILSVANWPYLPNNGFNKYLVGFQTDSLYPIDYKPGIPRNILAREIMHATSIDEAVDLIRSSKRAGGANFQVFDNNRIVELETTATMDSKTNAINIFPHTNHYLTDLSQYDKMKLFKRGYRNSLTRYRILKHNLDFDEEEFIRRTKKPRDDLDAKTISDILCLHRKKSRDHKADRGPCAHLFDEEGVVFQSIIDLKNKVLIVKSGTPCVADVHAYHPKW